MKRNLPEISLIIVNYKADREVARIQKSLQNTKNIELIVIDHSDGKNGFGAGCNTGAKQAKGETLIFMNPDVIVTEDALNSLHSFLITHPHVGMVGPQIRDEKQNIVISCSAVPNPLNALILYSWLHRFGIGKRIQKSYRLNNFDHDSSRPVPSLSGACFAMRRDDFLRIGGCDEQFFLYFEEFDLAQRIQRDLQKSIYFLATAQVVHKGQISTNQAKNVSQHFYNSRHYYMQKYYGLYGLIAHYWLRSQEILVQIQKKRRET